MIKKHLSEIITASGFFVIIALSLILFNRDPGRVSYAENRNLAVFPEMDGAEDVFSEGFTGKLSSWFEDNLGLRDMYLTISGILNYNLLHRAKTGKVELGKNGFLFLADEGNLDLSGLDFRIGEIAGGLFLGICEIAGSFTLLCCEHVTELGGISHCRSKMLGRRRFRPEGSELLAK